MKFRPSGERHGRSHSTALSSLASPAESCPRYPTAAARLPSGETATPKKESFGPPMSCSWRPPVPKPASPRLVAAGAMFLAVAGSAQAQEAIPVGMSSPVTGGAAYLGQHQQCDADIAEALE